MIHYVVNVHVDLLVKKNFQKLILKLKFFFYEGSRCETPFDICSLITCQNNGTRIVNITGCQCSCLCPSTFTGNLCQLGITPVNRTYTGQIIIPIDRPGGISWEIISQCIDQVWNNLNILLGKKISMNKNLFLKNSF